MRTIRPILFLAVLIALMWPAVAHAQFAGPIQIKQGPESHVDAVTLLQGELAWATDTNRLWIGTGSANSLLTPAWLVGSGAPSSLTGFAGDTYLDTATGHLYQRSGSGWGSSVFTFSAGSAPSFADSETPAGTINSSNTTFTLAHSPVSGSVHVFEGGSPTTLDRLMPSTYSVSGTTLTFSTAPASGSSILVDYRY